MRFYHDNLYGTTLTSSGETMESQVNVAMGAK